MPTTTHRLHWCAVYVNSRSEKKVAESLLQKHLEAYVPLVKTMRQWSDRKKLVELPLLNGYVFVKILPAQMDMVLQTRGVVAFVKSEGKVAVVREVEIARLRQLVELGYQMEVVGVNRNYRAGDKVKITSGALRGMEGVVHNQQGSKVIEILIESIGQCIRVKLPQDILLPA